MASSSSTTLPPTYRVGDTIKIDKKDDAYILQINDENGDVNFNIKYVVGNLTEADVALDRVTPIATSVSTTKSGVARHYSASAQIQRPSIQSTTTTNTST